MTALSLPILLAFWLVVVLLPIGAVLQVGFFGGGGSAAGAGLSFLTLFLSPEVLAVVRFTVVQAVLSACISGVLGLASGLWIGKHIRGRAGAWIKTLLLLPFGVPGVVAATAWTVLLSGTPWAFSASAVILAQIVFNVPFVTLQVCRAREEIREEEAEVASTLGASGFAVFRFVLWPAVKRHWIAACVQVFSFCVMSFALVLILGGGPPVQTLETSIYAHVRYGNLDLRSAAILGLWQMLLCLVPWALQLRWREHRELGEGTGRRRVESPSGRKIGRVLTAACFAVFWLFPYFSLLPNLAGIEALGRVLSQAWPSMRISLMLASGSAALSVAVALAAVDVARGAERRGGARFFWLSALLGLPSGISILVLGLGFWLAWGQWMDPFEGGVLPIVLLQSAVFYPVVFRMFWPISGTTSRTQSDAARSLGATRLQRLRHIEWPRWRGPLFSGLALVAGASLGEVAAVSLFYSEELVPVPLLVARWMGQYRFEEAGMLAALLLVLSMTVIASVMTTGERAS